MEGRNLKEVAEAIKNAKIVVALTGAGISTESGIPDFRSKDGLWSKFNMDEYGHIDNIISNPAKVWKMLRSLINDLRKAEPNPAHIALAKMEEMGYLHAIITQNVDSLHQRAGSKNVIEFHGNFREAICLQCRKIYPIEYALEQKIPRCECGGLLKPNAVFFGEPIERDVLIKSFGYAENCDVMLVVGTSAMVYPAVQLPAMAKQNGAMIVEINKEPSMIAGIADYSFYGKAGEILPKLVSLL
ncbi:MAG: NAD-dependent deacylase [Thermoplasmata archaeon]|nr:MAG: NAD-dependent deacylase [Thermoplasmata archaeon]